MSPVTRAARERLEAYVEQGSNYVVLEKSRQIVRENAPRRCIDQYVFRRLLDDLIAAVRGEHPEDEPF